MGCSNQRDKTLGPIVRYAACDLPEIHTRRLVLMDDGSTDGAAGAVRAEFSDVLMNPGDGSLSCKRGMLGARQRVLSLAPDSWRVVLSQYAGFAWPPVWFPPYSKLIHASPLRWTHISSGKPA